LTLIIQKQKGACVAYLRTKPREDGHGGVVDDVKVGQLIALLSQHKEDGVRKVDELREVEPPGHVQGIRCLQ